MDEIKETEPPVCPLPAPQPKNWTVGECPLCGYPQADIDPDGILWCPACGYSKKGCYT